MTIATQTKASLKALPIAKHWNTLVPEYRSATYPLLIMRVEWDPSYAIEIGKISEKRSRSRVNNYINVQELDRVRSKLKTKGEASIRFGDSKTGHGYNGERGDFCLVGGVIRGWDLTVFYRSLELIGGFAYDLTLIHYLERSLSATVTWKTVTFIATKANVFALKGNSNEKLYPKLVKIFQD